MKHPYNFLLCTHNQTFIKKNFESYLVSITKLAVQKNTNLLSYSSEVRSPTQVITKAIIPELYTWPLPQVETNSSYLNFRRKLQRGKN